MKRIVCAILICCLAASFLAAHVVFVHEAGERICALNVCSMEAGFSVDAAPATMPEPAWEPAFIQCVDAVFTIGIEQMPAAVAASIDKPPTA